EIDALGLDRIDRQLLITMAEKFAGGPVGLETLAASISEEPETVEDVYEPYLMKIGFLQRTPRGRMITYPACRHLGIKVPGKPEQNALFEMPEGKG
ncbi:MAG TPA: Holliday junction branch migration DNA helicase RuvB, partial [Firmicutes bacterium]|nr:Holliday junction branch migration DNA helicase RuvB [Bacillota bacterium]